MTKIEHATQAFTRDIVSLIKANILARLETLTVVNVLPPMVGATGPGAYIARGHLTRADAALGTDGGVVMTPTLSGEYVFGYAPKVTAPTKAQLGRALNKAVAKSTLGKPSVLTGMPERGATEEQRHNDAVRLSGALRVVRDSGKAGAKAADIGRALGVRREVAVMLLSRLRTSRHTTTIGRTKGTRWVATGAK